MFLYFPGRPKRYDPATGKGLLPPHEAGEYRIRDAKTNAILYIGETCDLRRRMQEHVRDGKISEYLKTGRRKSCYFEYKIANKSSTSEERRKHERRKIRQHSPKMNKSAGGEGRVAK